jgi:hypothetical protein
VQNVISTWVIIRLSHLHWIRHFCVFDIAYKSSGYTVMTIYTVIIEALKLCINSRLKNIKASLDKHLPPVLQLEQSFNNVFSLASLIVLSERFTIASFIITEKFEAKKVIHFGSIHVKISMQLIYYDTSRIIFNHVDFEFDIFRENTMHHLFNLREKIIRFRPLT